MIEARRRIALIYERFARLQAHGRSALYEEISRQIADDEQIQDFLAGMPEWKWQPNLFLGAVQFVSGTPADWPGFRQAVFDNRDAIADQMMRRTTQTNQAARCATLLPVLAQLPQPLALIEVGASAGLCLLPDRYGYEYVVGEGDHRTVHRVPAGPSAPTGAPVFRCTASPSVPLPAQPVDVVWRAGLDLNPLDLHDADARAWLDALIWPEEGSLRTDLHAAIDVARADPPPIHRGDLRTDLPALAAEAPRDATLVVFHTAVLAYLTEADDRESFARAVARTGAVWLANETPARIPGVDQKAIDTHPLSEFLLCRDGEPVARTDPHGASITWMSDVTSNT